MYELKKWREYYSQSEKRIKKEMNWFKKDSQKEERQSNDKK